VRSIPKSSSPPAAANRLLAALPRKEYRSLRPALGPVPLEAEQVLVEPGQPIRHVYFPDRGVVSILALMEDGAGVEAGLVGREGMVGLPLFLGRDTAPFRVIVQVPGTGQRVEAGLYREALRQGRALDELLRGFLDAFLTHLALSAACNSRHSVEKRCCRWLLLAHDRVGEDEFPLTQKFLAAMLSVRRTGVAEVAGGLQRAGLIRYRRGWMTILDRQALEEAACPCFQVVKDRFDRIHAPT
jgi:CRP-like cAMP-binding protein